MSTIVARISVIERMQQRAQALLFKQLYNEKDIEYWGWIKAPPEHKGLLRALGVGGEMKYNEDRHCFEFCICKKATMEALMLGFPTFWPGCFTACVGDNQLPYDLQEYWHYPTVLILDRDRVWYDRWQCPRCGAIMKLERRRCGNCMAYRNFLETDYP